MKILSDIPADWKLVDIYLRFSKYTKILLFTTTPSRDLLTYMRWSHLIRDWDTNENMKIFWKPETRQYVVFFDKPIDNYDGFIMEVK